ncbi:MAG: hypothetical protein FGM57_00890 [Candidatus Taylorbacteria bacterium]|nr:hypothetical protein [Candidatus Taylorbacteria bacterium]
MDNLISKFKVKVNRLKKNLHPLEIRKKITYMSARNSKHVVVNPRLEAYMDKLIAKGEKVEDLYEMNELWKNERSYLQVPLTEARFLEVLVKSIGAKNVIEIGTFCGFSTAFIARGLVDGGIVFTCDEDSRYVQIAKNFWEHLGVSERIHFELGEATKILHRMVDDKPSLEFFDIAFVDADKENYRQYAELCMKLLRKGGVLLIDNTLWKGLVQYKDPRDNSAVHIQAVNEWVFETFGKNASMIPAWDGLLMVVKE